MRSVYKYVFDNPAGTMELELPRRAEVVHVGEQNGKVCMWIVVDVSAGAEHELRRYRTHGTGHAIVDSYAKHVGTAFVGPFVWHVFEH